MLVLLVTNPVTSFLPVYLQKCIYTVPSFWAAFTSSVDISALIFRAPLSKATLMLPALSTLLRLCLADVFPLRCHRTYPRMVLNSSSPCLNSWLLPLQACTTAPSYVVVGLRARLVLSEQLASSLPFCWVASSPLLSGRMRAPEHTLIMPLSSLLLFWGLVTWTMKFQRSLFLFLLGGGGLLGQESLTIS